DVGVDLAEARGGAFQLRFADPGLAVEDLPLEVRAVHDVRVDQSDPSHARGGEVERGGRSEPAGADAQDGGGSEAQLPRGPHAGDGKVARVALALFGGQTGH